MSGIQTGALGSLAAQVAADGAFHALMYVIATLGLIELCRARLVSASFDAQPSSGLFWIGFGVWHILDTVLSHWITGIHRVKMDADSPLIWDIAWVVVFGIVPLLYGWRARIHKRLPPDGQTRRKTYFGLLAAAVMASAMANLFPFRADADTTVIALRPGVAPTSMLQTLADTEARIVWSDPQGSVWVMSAIPEGKKFALFRSGAQYVSGTAAPAGCSAWLRADPSGSHTKVSPAQSHYQQIERG
ncbi:DUF2243 domain-containing protein [Achromobacter mucicolens]|nr:DUF2243 domain-containing protein [Achromobacter mucicolens]WBX91668.1 DUF2243 domain-containing protein [Achromobacter mucicolens]